MSSFDEYSGYDGIGLADLVRRKELQPLELVETAIGAIETFNPQVNAVIHKMYDGARKIAAAPLPEGPFCGVPFLLKDLLAGYAGEPLQRGSRFHRHDIAAQHSRLVQRYLASGVVVLGKTNTSEYGITNVTEPGLFGPTNNPWDLDRTAGGSSGGSAAAVAARMVPMAHGGDGLGSIRIPASCCGVFGLKPSRDRNPGLDYEPWQHFVCEHVITRSVRDSAAMLTATAVDPDTDYLEEVTTTPGKLRIAFTAEPFLGDTVEPDCEAVLADTVSLCRELGHELVEAAPPIDGRAFARAVITMMAAEVRADIEEAAAATHFKPGPGEFDVTTWALSLLGRQLCSSDLVKATRLMQRAACEVLQFFDDYDVLLTPTLAQAPVETGSVLPKGAEALGMKVLGRLRAGGLLQTIGMLDKAADESFRFTPYTTPFNATGQPAMSIPLGWSERGLPIGMQFVGRSNDEATLFRLAGQLERARPWINRIPPIAANDASP